MNLVQADLSSVMGMPFKVLNGKMNNKVLRLCGYINKQYSYYHLKKMAMVNRYDVWIPHFTTENHLLNRVAACVFVIRLYKQILFFNYIIIDDQKLISKKLWSLPAELIQTVGIA